MAEESIRGCEGLRLAIVHYHLHPGGVTTVIEHSVAGLEEVGRVEVLVLSGEPYAGNKLSNVQVVPQLAYQDDLSQGSPESLAEAVECAARTGFGGRSPDIWHCHNHALGKHVHFPDAIGALVRRGHRFLLQIHDFAEDGRPKNFSVLSQAKAPYPLVPPVRFATVNSRDRRLLQEAGVPASQVCHLPNPVDTHASKPSLPGGERPVFLYPTRGIRRKNLGEAVFLAALLRDRGFIVTTRAPDNPRWQAIHDEWVIFARERRLPIAFDVVDRKSPADLELSPVEDASFDAWLGQAACFLTTSVAEGFGLAYLESIVDGQPLIGRDLPEITADFKEQGLSFPGLYRALRVPLDWMGEERLIGELQRALNAFYQTYQQAVPEDALAMAFASMTDERDGVDFGRLDESFQREIIDRALGDAGFSEVMVETEGGSVHAELWLESWFASGRPNRNLAGGRRVLEECYSVRAHAARLLVCYRELIDGPPAASGAPLASDVGSRLLGGFLSPERFHFLRS